MLVGQAEGRSLYTPVCVGGGEGGSRGGRKTQVRRPCAADQRPPRNSPM